MAPILIGNNNNVSAIKVGDKDVASVYVGDKQVWSGMPSVYAITITGNIYKVDLSDASKSKVIYSSERTTSANVAALGTIGGDLYYFSRTHTGSSREFNKFVLSTNTHSLLSTTPPRTGREVGYFASLSMPEIGMSDRYLTGIFSGDFSQMYLFSVSSDGTLTYHTSFQHTLFRFGLLFNGTYYFGYVTSGWIRVAKYTSTPTSSISRGGTFFAVSKLTGNPTSVSCAATDGNTVWLIDGNQRLYAVEGWDGTNTVTDLGIMPGTVTFRGMEAV